MHLTRWQAVVDAIRAWHETPEPRALDAARGVLERLDPVQRELCWQLFQSYLAMAKHDDQVNFEPDWREVTDRQGKFLLSARPTMEVTTEAGREAVKIRTGSSSITDAEEAALLVAGREGSGDEVLVDLLLARNDSVAVTPPPDTARVLEGLFETRHEVGERRPKERPRRPGLHCYACARPAFCGAYFAADGRRPGSNARLVTVSKTALADLVGCERRAAWRSVHSIPPDDRDEGATPGLAFGSAVDELLAEILLAADPQAAAEGLLAHVHPSDAADFRLFVARHVGLESEHEPGLTYRAAKVQAGITFVMDGNLGQVVVVFMCEMDATGRESDGTPAVIDHKTGSRPLPLEAELYAVTGSLLARAHNLDADRVAVHHHHLGRPETPRCDRRVFRNEDLEEATATLAEAAAKFAGLDPTDSMQPRPKVLADDSCTTCLYRARCGAHGGPCPE